MKHQEMQAQIERGEGLSPEQELALVESRDLIVLGMLASAARARRSGTVGTFVRVHTVDVVDAASVTVPAEAGEVRLTGAGTLAARCAAVRSLAERVDAPLTGFALDELATAAGDDLSAWCRQLREAGLTAIAHARIDRIDSSWLETARGAGLAVHTVSIGAPLDQPALLEALRRVRDLQASTHAFDALQPLPIEHSADAPTTGYDDMHGVALASLVVRDVPHIQVSWARAGAKLAQACLLFGADDITDVPAHDAMPHGPRRAIVEEVRRNIAAVSLTPAERDAAFRVRELQT
jgi:2-iminoacetate synthase ThiH